MIRKALASDTDAIQQVAERAYGVYVKSLGRPPAPMVADFKRHIKRDWVIVDECDGRIRGYAILVIDDRLALLDNIAVDPATQRLGVGRGLIDRVEKRALECGFDRLDLYTNIVMTDSFRWYQKLGFAETRRITEDGFHRIYMKKAICQVR